MIAIGYLALAFAGFCGIVSLIGAAMPETKKRPEADYNKIYEAICPKEL